MKNQKPGIVFIFILVVLLALATVDHLTNKEDTECEVKVIELNGDSTDLHKVLY